MATTAPDKSGPQQPTSGIARALRQCLVSSVLFIDAEGKTATLCPQAAGLLGLAQHSCPAATLPAAVRALVQEVQTSGKATGTRDLEIRLPHKAAMHLRASAVPIPAGHKRHGVALSLAQVAGLAQCDEHLQQLERLANTGRLAASTAHEIRNALVAGKTFIELLLEKNRDVELTEVVGRELGRIDGLVNRFLRFPGSEGRLKADVRLHQVLDYSLRLVQGQLAGKSITVERRFRAGADSLQGDERALQQTFVNLLLNALEAMPGQGTLTVGTELVSAAGVPKQGRPQLRVTIQDTGSGITAENLEHLFEPFFTTKPGGTGLGLAIAHQIMQEHGGTISVESSPGRGTTFSLLLPAGQTAG